MNNDHTQSNHQMAKLSETKVHRVPGHQTHSMIIAGCRKMTHCGPLILFRVVELYHVTSFATGWVIPATCRASGVKIKMVQDCPMSSAHQLLWTVHGPVPGLWFLVMLWACWPPAARRSRHPSPRSRWMPSWILDPGPRLLYKPAEWV